MEKPRAAAAAGHVGRRGRLAVGDAARPCAPADAVNRATARGRLTKKGLGASTLLRTVLCFVRDDDYDVATTLLSNLRRGSNSNPGLSVFFPSATSTYAGYI